MKTVQDVLVTLLVLLVLVGLPTLVNLTSTALAEFDVFPRDFNELRKFTTLPTLLMASMETFFLPKQC